MIKVGMVSLGCSKNQVDAERIMADIKAHGMELENDPHQCDAIIVNTCGFIEAAKTESIENILECAQLKEEGRLKVVAVTGCLAQRYQQELAEEIPEADVILGIGSNHQIVDAIKAALDGQRVTAFGSREALSLEGERVLAGEPYTAYLKIAEGCDNRCSYCAIPMIRGQFRSRTIENIVAEAKRLAEQGVTELNVVAQDTTRYGEDIYGRLALPELLAQLVKLEGIHWIRLLYCYPERITEELVQLIKTEDKIVKYLDIPLQHASPQVLKRMNRPVNIEDTCRFLESIRKEMPEVTIRTTLIAGFPGETEEQFEALCKFVEEMRFDRLGCFAYSPEEGTPAMKLGGHMDEEIRQRRADIIMEIQMDIAADMAATHIGRELEVLVEGYDDEMEMYFGRSYMDAPDVDTKVYFTAEGSPKAGEYVSIKITDSTDYDLIGIIKEI